MTGCQLFLWLELELNSIGRNMFVPAFIVSLLQLHLYWTVNEIIGGGLEERWLSVREMGDKEGVRTCRM